MDDKLEELLNDSSEFDSIKALLAAEEEHVLPRLNIPSGCIAPGPPAAPTGSYQFPSARSTESLQMVFQQVLPGGTILSGGTGLRGAPGGTPTGGGTQTISISYPSTPINIVAAYFYWNIVMAADNNLDGSSNPLVGGSAAFFNYGDSIPSSITGTGFFPFGPQNLNVAGSGPYFAGNPGPAQVIGIAQNCGWAAYYSGSGPRNDGGTAPQNIVNVVCRYDMLGNGLIPNGIGIGPGTTNISLSNFPFQPGIGNATAGSDSAYYPGCKVGQGAVVLIVYSVPTSTKMNQVTIYDGAAMIADPSSGWSPLPGGNNPGTGQYTINYNSKYILNPVFLWAAGDAQTTYSDKALVNGVSLGGNGSGSYFNPNVGNLMALNVENNTVKLNSGHNTFTVDATGGTELLNFFLFAIAAGDPHFAGFDGEKFDFHGEPHKFYNLLSDDNIQVNAYFSDWPSDTSGHDFTATRRAGITIKDDSGIYKIVIDSDGYVAVNNFELKNSKYLTFGVNTVVRIIDNYDDIGHKDLKDFDGFGDFTCAYEVSTAEYRIIFVSATDNYNGYYLNFLAEIKNPDLRPHGVVGQTADGDGKPRKAIPHTYQGEGVIEGNYPDYEVSGLFDNDFKYNKFMVDKLIVV